MAGAPDDLDALERAVDKLYDHIADLKTGDKDATDTVETAIDLLDRGVVRVAEVDGTGAVRCV